MRATGEPEPFEVYAPGVYLHGTKAELEAGEVLVPGRESNFEDGRVMNHVYFTATLDAAVWGAELAEGMGRGRIYIVEPAGAFEDDPNKISRVHGRWNMQVGWSFRFLL
jgi:rifampin ADP-ribosylating transferase